VADRLFGRVESIPVSNLPAWLGPAFAAGVLSALVFGGFMSRAPGAKLHEGLPVMAALGMGPMLASNEFGLSGALTPLRLTKVDLNLNKNLCSKAIFEWTNSGHSPSSNRSFPSVWTNRNLF
jgi:hypothetical protein